MTDGVHPEYNKRRQSGRLRVHGTFPRVRQLPDYPGVHLVFFDRAVALSNFPTCFPSGARLPTHAGIRRAEPVLHSKLSGDGTCVGRAQAKLRQGAKDDGHQDTGEVYGEGEASRP